MIPTNKNSSALSTPHGIAVNSSVYGRAIRLAYGLVRSSCPT